MCLHGHGSSGNPSALMLLTTEWIGAGETAAASKGCGPKLVLMNVATPIAVLAGSSQEELANLSRHVDGCCRLEKRGLYPVFLSVNVWVRFDEVKCVWKREVWKSSVKEEKEHLVVQSISSVLLRLDKPPFHTLARKIDIWTKCCLFYRSNASLHASIACSKRKKKYLTVLQNVNLVL